MDVANLIYSAGQGLNFFITLFIKPQFGIQHSFKMDKKKKVLII